MEFYVAWAESVGKSSDIEYSISMADGTSLPAESIQFDADMESLLYRLTIESKQECIQ